jgi:uncharacterized protein (DUF302 family)
MRILIGLVLCLGLVVNAQADNGLITKKSELSVAKTLDKLEKIIKKKGLTLFARVNHSVGAKKVGLELRPTELLIFGNPKMGTPLMQSNQTMGIDLPMKALAWQDASGQVWITYNDPSRLAKRHSITSNAPIIKKMTGALGKLTGAASKK